MTPNRDGTANARPRPGGVVLVVDDDPVIREVVVAMLAGGGRPSLAAATAAEAVAQAADPANRVTVALVDVTIPGVRGLDLFTRLKAETPAVAIVAMTGLTNAESLAALTAAGVAGVLPKPFTAAQLLAAVNDAG